MYSRREFLNRALLTGLGLPVWHRLSTSHALAQMVNATDYRAIVCVELQGGNDGNNMLIPFTGAEYTQYQALRSLVAYSQPSLIPLNPGAYSYPLAVNSSLPNVAKMFNAGHASFVANVGPMRAPLTKAQLLADPTLLPPSLLSHPAGIVQWQSASTDAVPGSGWGGRIADQITGQSGSLPMVMTASENSIFTSGQTVQGITVQGGTIPQVQAIPMTLQAAELALAAQDATSSNQIISQAAKVRSASIQQQLLLSQAKTAGATLKTQFPAGNFGNVLTTIAQLINGRSVIGASRQIFYCSQGSYDTHEYQLANQGKWHSELDLGLAAFVQALQEMGLSDQVLICTQSDFNRSMQANGQNGTDHGWGNHQLIIGGGIKGGKIIGSLPELELGGSQDLNGVGTWIPTLSVSQMAAGVGTWMGLSSPQLSTAFPELAHFPSGPISLT